MPVIAKPHYLADTVANLPIDAAVGDLGVAGAAPTLYMHRGSGVWLQSGIKHLFNQTGMFPSVTNVTTENSVLGTTGIGTRTLDAGFWTQNRTARIYAGGTYQTPGTPGNVTVRLRFGTVVLAQAQILGSVLSSNSTTNRVFAEVFLRCDSVGTTGTLYMDGAMQFGISLVVGTITVPLYAAADLDNGGNAATIDTTQAGLLDITAQWSSASASQGTKCTIVNVLQYT